MPRKKKNQVETDAKHPHGYCECNGPMCCHGMGPAAFEVTRDGRRMRVCTRCDLKGDANKVSLIRKKDNANIYLDFDPLGAMCLAFEQATSRSK